MRNIIERNQLEAHQTALTIALLKEITMNKFLSFLIAVLAIAQASAFMGAPVLSQRQSVRIRLFCFTRKGSEREHAESDGCRGIEAIF